MTDGQAGRSDRGTVFGLLFAAAWVLLFFMFRDGLKEMERVWAEPEYSHAYLIPFLSLYVLSTRLGALRETQLAQSWFGVAIVVCGLVAYVAGEISALFIIVQYGFLITLWGLMVTVLGLRGSRVIWASLIFLVFLVPLPRFFQYSLSSGLQLVSSELGTAMLRLMGVRVFLEGNVIDLGTYKLQVVEACSGLRYLFPLMSFGFLCAILFRGPLWQRWTIFVSSLPITVVMNSFRIAVTGVLVNRFGTEAADGFLHYFEGWVIFTACLVLMFLEMALFARLGRRKLDDVFDVHIPELRDFRGWLAGRNVGAPLVAAVVLMAGGAVASLTIPDREEIIPQYASLGTFPLNIGNWQGKPRTIGEQELELLKLTEYAMISYQNVEDRGLVELYVAYYESQRKGTSAHSPRACLPGSGWVFEEFGQVDVPDILPDGAPVPVNRVLVSMGDERLLVYYWFMQRGRLITNEYLVKWYIFWDSITRRRTDGALVRLITPVSDVAAVPAAEAELRAFLAKAYPALYYHIPQQDIAP
jgi:exosortase D (VPLPA-CTERM-specific)